MIPSRFFKIFAFLSFILATQARASETCFEIHWEASGEEEGPNGRQNDGSLAFITINGNIPAYLSLDPKTAVIASNGKYLSSKSRGCIDSRKLAVGNNNFVVNFIIGSGAGDRQSIKVGYLGVTAHLILPNGSVHLIGREVYRADPNRFEWAFNKSINLKLEQIAPELVALANDMKSSVAQSLTSIGNMEPTIDADIRTYEAILANIDEKNFYDITEADVQNYGEAKEKLAFLKSKLDQKKETIAAKTSRLKEETKAVRAQIESALASEGMSITADDFLSAEIDLQIDAFANIGGQHAIDLNQFPYDNWADQSLQELTYFYDAGQTTNFLEKAELWTRQSERMLLLVTSRSKVSHDELNAFEAAQKKVKDYLFGTYESDGKVTSDFWMKATKIDPELRRSIDVDLAAVDEAKAKELKAYANGLREFSERLISNLKTISALARAYKEAESQAEKDFVEKMIDGGIAAVKSAPKIAECLAENYIAGPYADYYELVEEKDFCTGEPNSELDRFIAGTSLTMTAGGALLATPAGGWVAGQLAKPLKFVTKLVTAVKSAAASAANAAKLERIGTVLSIGIIHQTIKNSDEAKTAVKGAFHLGAEMEQKILKGAISPKNEFFGGHSPSLMNNSDITFRSSIVNPDGTTRLEGLVVKIDGKDYKKSKTTLFPADWTDEKILANIRAVAGSKEVGRRARDGATLYIRIMDKVEILIIREGEKVTSAFPTGTVGYWMDGFDRI